VAVEILIETEGWRDVDVTALAVRAVGATLRHRRVDPACDVSVLACDDARIAALNSDFRDRPRPTNVLSWPSEERGACRDGAAPAAPHDPELGDIAIALGTCAAEAAAAGIPLADHATHLLVHATLHLLGYDHVRDGDAALMETLETEILADLGLPDPYSR